MAGSAHSGAQIASVSAERGEADSAQVVSAPLLYCGAASARYNFASNARNRLAADLLDLADAAGQRDVL